MLLTSNDVSEVSPFLSDSVLFSGFQGSGKEQTVDVLHSFLICVATSSIFNFQNRRYFLRETTVMQNMLYHICKSVRVGKRWYLKICIHICI